MGKDETGAFRTHSNYLGALACEAGLAHLGKFDTALGQLQARVKACSSMSDTPSGGVDLDQVKKSLANAWGTEWLLAMTGRFLTEDEVIRVSNNWAVVQAYYVVYHATQALAVAKGFPRPASHPKTQNQFMAFWVTRPLDLSPWTLGVNDAGPVNCPSGRPIKSGVHNFETPDPGNQLALAFMALRTTRDDTVSQAMDKIRGEKIAARRRAWQEVEEQRRRRGQTPRTMRETRPRLTAAEKTRAQQATRPHGFIHYLYRLRIKANYLDPTMFTEGPSDEWASSLVHRDLRYLASATLLVHELHIAKLVGNAVLAKWADDWLASNASGTGDPLGLQLRRSFL